MKELPLIAPEETKVLDLTDETKFADNGIVSRTVLNTPHSRTILFGFAEGQELSEHTSTQHALIHILSGECEFNLDGKVHTLKVGAFLHMPPNLRHAVQAKQPFSMLLTLIKPAHKSESGSGDGHC
ncbi:MAG: cupin domain-containing protein [Verrucomicrobiae bacterium]|nr:cupin domain-containing protein [Verrucomicrobiae bacterium]